MKVNITVVATKTLMAGLEPADVAMLRGRATAYQGKPIEDSIGERGWEGRFPTCSSTSENSHDGSER
jgi:hypothetical protein